MLNNRRLQLCKNPVRGEEGGHNFHFLSGLVFFFKEAQKLCISFFRGADREINPQVVLLHRAPTNIQAIFGIVRGETGGGGGGEGKGSLQK